MMTRRDMLATSAAAIAAGAVIKNIAPAFAQESPATEPAHDLAVAGSFKNNPAPFPPGVAGKDYMPVSVPNGSTLSWKIIDGAKVFHLIAEEVEHEFAPGLTARCWGYNGAVHGPVIEAVEGDRVRIYVTNRLPAATTVHWHGVLTPNGMDGVGGLSQKAIAPGETYKYEFTLRQNGLCMYHAHHDEMTQMGMGLTGLFVIHPRATISNDAEPEARVDRDFAILLHEWRIDPGTSRPNPNEMTEFNILTINAKVFPATEPLVIKRGERVRIRMGNLSAMEHHPMHIHGFIFHVTETEGGRIPKSARRPESTVLIPVGATRTIEFVADEPGDWALHCHMSHHVMNQMGHNLPNMIGVKSGDLDQKIRPLLPMYMTMGQAGMADMGAMGMQAPPNSIPMAGGRGKHDYITMGGMFTILKVREALDNYNDPGWYENPAGTLALPATPSELAKDGIDPGASSPRY